MILCLHLCLTAQSLLVGSPAGGALYTRFGFRAPFVFGEICTLVDLVLRLLVIERDVALRWGYDPSEPNVVVLEAPDAPRSAHPFQLPEIQFSTTTFEISDTGANKIGHSIPLDKPKQLRDDSLGEPSLSVSRRSSRSSILTSPPTQKSVPLLSVVRKLSQSPRALVALTMAFVYG